VEQGQLFQNHQLMLLPLPLLRLLLPLESLRRSLGSATAAGTLLLLPLLALVPQEVHSVATASATSGTPTTAVAAAAVVVVIVIAAAAATVVITASVGAPAPAAAAVAPPPAAANQLKALEALALGHELLE
jgi:hypothetical protein